jgi:hypothetical protein
MGPGAPVAGLSAPVGTEPTLASALALLQRLAADLTLAALLDLDDTSVDNQRALGLIVCSLPGYHGLDLLLPGDQIEN